MNFENLMAAIKANGEEAPSLTLAFHLIQSVVKDIEQESGQKFKNVDIGDEYEYTGLLGGQMRVLLNTYAVTSESQEGVSERLSAMNEKLENAEKETEGLLESISAMEGVEKQIAEAEKKKDGLAERLKGLESREREYESIVRQCEELEKQISDMQNYDIAEKTKEKEELEKKASAFDSQVVELNSTIQKLKSTIADLTKQLSSAEAEAKKAEDEKEGLEKQIAAANEGTARLLGELKKLQASINEAEQKKKAAENDLEAARERKTRLEEESAALKVEYDKLYTEEINGLIAKNDEMRSAIEDQENYKKGLFDQKASLEKKYTELLQAIAELQNKEIPELEGKLKTKTAETARLEGEKAVLVQKLRALNEELDMMQKDIASNLENVKKLEDELIPQSASRFAVVENDYKKKLAEHQEMLAQIDKCLGDTEKLSKENASSAEQLKKKQEELEELRSRLSSNNKDIEQLQNILEDLKGKADRDSVEAIRKGLQAEIEEHKKLIDEKKKLEEESRKLRRDIEEVSGLIEKLEAAIKEYESEKKKLERKRSEFRFADDPEFIEKVRLLREKTILAMQIKGKLEACSASLSKALGYNTTVIYTDMEESISSDLKEVDNYLSSLLASFKKYAEEFIDNIGGE